MNPWKTDLQVTPSQEKINQKDSILTIGSCFSQAIGDQLKINKFNALVNPFGTIYNPVSIHELLTLAIQNRMPDNQGYVTHQDVHYHHQFHATFSSLKQLELKNQIAASIDEVNQFIKTGNQLIITYGTAWAFRKKDTDQLVANCHKIPATHFSKWLLTQEVMLASFREIYELIRSVNPLIKIILTASPVRHVKETLELNAVSKSALRLFCHRAVAEFGVDYFPSYEIMMDDLRDYRFYKQDRIHPTAEAEEYIWQKFGERYFDKPTLGFLETWSDIRASLAHRPSFPSTSQHQAFLQSLLKKIESVGLQIDVSNEIDLVKSQLIER